MSVFLACMMATMLGTAGYAQMPMMPGPDGTLTVMAAGQASAPAEWLDVSVTLEGQGETAETALATVRDQVDRAVVALMDMAIPEELISRDAPQISSGVMMGRMMGNQNPMKWSVTAKVTVRVTGVPADTMYDWAVKILDKVGTVSQTADMPSGGMMQMMMPGAGPLTFGIEDEAGLKQKALADAIDKARQSAQAAAKASGKELGELSSLQVMELTGQGLMAVMQMFSAETEPGMAAQTIFVAAGFKLK